MDTVSSFRPPITLVLAVAVRLYRDGLAATLGAHPQLRIGGSAGTSPEAQAMVIELAPDVVVVDASLDDVHGLMRNLRAGSPKLRILAFAVEEEVSTILEYAAAGADGFVTANGSVVELVEAIERVAAGELLCSPRIAAELLRRAAQRLGQQAQQNVAHLFTGREYQVFHQLKQGRSNKEIATALCIAEATVKNHVHHVLEKLKVTTRRQAAAASLPCSLPKMARTTTAVSRGTSDST